VSDYLLRKDFFPLTVISCTVQLQIRSRGKAITISFQLHLGIKYWTFTRLL